MKRYISDKELSQQPLLVLPAARACIMSMVPAGKPLRLSVVSLGASSINQLPKELGPDDNYSFDSFLEVWSIEMKSKASEQLERRST